MTRRQCKKCPWKPSTNPYDIPNGYDAERHRALDRTISGEPMLTGGELHIMACHETSRGREKPCVGWLHNQLGVGNNLGLRLRVLTGQIDTNFEIVGPQHARFEDTLPAPRKRKAQR